MKLYEKILLAFLFSFLIVCCFAIFTVPQDESEIKISIYNNDGRILEMEPENAELYKKDGWSRNFSDVITTVWKTNGESKEIFKAQTAVYTKEGWYTNKDAVMVLMKKGEKEKEVFLDLVKDYEEKGWSVVRAAAPGQPSNQEQKNDAVKTSAEQIEKVIALTFDDGPNPITTPRLLEALQKNNAKATFFLLGSLVKQNASVLNQMSNYGMEIGSHTYNHKHLPKLSAQAMKDEINQTNQVIKETIGKQPTVMRPPYGEYSQGVLSAAGVPVIMWSVDTLDWKTQNTQSTVDNVLKNAKDGSIVLFHDIYEPTVKAVEILIPELQRMGYRLVTVSELAAIKQKTISPGSIYHNF